jgi:hypothetical protein
MFGFSGVRARYIWNRASTTERDVLLAAMGLWEGSYHNDLLSRRWEHLPAVVQTSLIESLKSPSLWIRIGH